MVRGAEINKEVCNRIRNLIGYGSTIDETIIAVSDSIDEHHVTERWVRWFASMCEKENNSPE